MKFPQSEVNMLFELAPSTNSNFKNYIDYNRLVDIMFFKAWPEEIPTAEETEFSV